MPTPPSILNKVKLLLGLANSPNPHEADNARKLADALIEKHTITEEELESLKDAKPLYGEDEKIYESIGIVSWKQQLLVSISNYFDCQVVQEELVPADGPHPFHYFAYGEPEDVGSVRTYFQSFCSQVEQLLEANCQWRGPVYKDSYCDGVVDAIKQNIQMYGIRLPAKKIVPVEKEAVLPSEEALTKTKEKPKPADRHVDVNSQTMIKDIMAYFRGVDDGKDLLLDASAEALEDNSKGLIDET